MDKIQLKVQNMIFSWFRLCRVRYYYVYRNWLLLQKYKYIPLKRRLRILFFIPIRLVVYLIISEDRFSLTKYSLEGLRDGILGRSGPYK